MAALFIFLFIFLVGLVVIGGIRVATKFRNSNTNTKVLVMISMGLFSFVTLYTCSIYSYREEMIKKYVPGFLSVPSYRYNYIVINREATCFLIYEKHQCSDRELGSELLFPFQKVEKKWNTKLLQWAVKDENDDIWDFQSMEEAINAAKMLSGAILIIPDEIVRDTIENSLCKDKWGGAAFFTFVSLIIMGIIFFEKTTITLFKVAGYTSCGILAIIIISSIHFGVGFLLFMIFLALCSIDSKLSK